jgi:predicted site-specific integrase-resolvase
VGSSAREGRPIRAALYARVSTHDQQTLGVQVEATAVYIKGRGLDLVRQGSNCRPSMWRR